MHEVPNTEILEFDFIWLTPLSIVRKAGRRFIGLNPRVGGKLRFPVRIRIAGPGLLVIVTSG